MCSLKRQRVLLGSVVLAGLLLILGFPAAATVEEQRARLPPPATCADPVEGVWKALTHNEGRNKWTQFTLSIVRPNPHQPNLNVDILFESWFGGRDVTTPPACHAGYYPTVQEPGRGTIHQLDVDILGTSWANHPQSCTRLSEFGYYLDHFTGTIDPERQEFQSLNNDGGADINEPYVFRRIRCVDRSTPPPPLPGQLSVPPTFRVARRRGCSR